MPILQVLRSLPITGCMREKRLREGKSRQLPTVFADKWSSVSKSDINAWASLNLSAHLLVTVQDMFQCRKIADPLIFSGSALYHQPDLDQFARTVILQHNVSEWYQTAGINI